MLWQVSTYIKCFTSSNQQPAIDCPTLFLFLESHTRHLLTILSYIPSSSQLDGSTPPPASLVLDLAKLSLTIWSSWVSDLSSDVNDKGGMYPHSVVTHWNDTLEQLVVGPPSLSSSVLPPSNASARGSHWLSSTPLTAGANQPAKLLVSSFQEAFTPIRDQFVSQVGWLVGRQPSMEYNWWGDIGLVSMFGAWFRFPFSHNSSLFLSVVCKKIFIRNADTLHCWVLCTNTVEWDQLYR